MSRTGCLVQFKFVGVTEVNQPPTGLTWWKEKCMGLDATVYSDESWDEEELLADVHLGNISGVGQVREEAGEFLPEDSVFLTKVVYSGSHCGDELAVEYMPQLIDECLLLQTKTTDEFTKNFARKVSGLAFLALAHARPITF
jgi:hypothetical protein